MKKIVILFSLIFATSLLGATDLDSLAIPSQGAKSLGPTQPLPGFESMKPGQWATYKWIENGQLIRITKTAYLAHENGVWTIESVSIEANRQGATQMQVKGLEKMLQGQTGDDVEILSVKMKNGTGPVQELPKAILSTIGGTYKKMIPDYSVKALKLKDNGPITVAAGTFAQTLKDDESVVKTTYGEGKATTIYHSAVPTKIVKMTTFDNKVIMELVDFGDSGFVSSF